MVPGIGSVRGNRWSSLGAWTLNPIQPFAAASLTKVDVCQGHLPPILVRSDWELVRFGAGAVRSPFGRVW